LVDQCFSQGCGVEAQPGEVDIVNYPARDQRGGQMQHANMRRVLADGERQFARGCEPVQHLRAKVQRVERQRA
jgi:hypothetical protein